MFVWQDLMDGGLITRICDNEYILKDSELSPGENSPRCIDVEAATEAEVTKVSVMETLLAEMKIVKYQEMALGFMVEGYARLICLVLQEDLMDGGLITPICDNEYILKDTHIPSSPYPYSSFDSESAPAVNSPRCIDVEAVTEPEVTKVSVMETLLAEMKTVKLEDTDKVLPDEHKYSENVSMMDEELKEMDLPGEVQNVEMTPLPAEIGMTYHQMSNKGSKRCRRTSRIFYRTFSNGIDDNKGSRGIDDNKGSPLLPLQREEYRRSFSTFRYIKWKLRG